MPLDALTFDNRFRAGLPGEAEPRPGVRPVAGAWSAVAPTPVAAPRVIAHSREIAAQLGLTGADVADPAFAAVFGGNALLQGMAPWAANYGGHQFGHWAGQLGDGRAISLGEALGVDGQRLELQLKGAGPTPFSRGADGRAVLRSSVREFLCSEAMHHLGVPTTRALSLVATGDDVVRDMFYDGRPAPEPGAIVCRVAPSFIRFGTFELPASRGDRDLLQDLVEFTISRDFPHLSGDGEALYAAWFADVCTRTATLMAHWMRVGFVHGVMNTDNLSILGLTIDYGPYGWLEDYDPDWTPNTTDAQGRRYRYAWQPRVAHWNLGRLAQALSPLFATAAPLQAALDGYAAAYAAAEADTIARKLGFATFREDDRALMDALQALLHDGEVDMTLWFRALGETDPAAPDMTMFDDAFYDAAKQAATASAFADWMALYAARTAADGHDAATRRAVMRAANPKYVLRNWLAQEAIDRAAAGDDDGITALLEVLRRPYEDQPGREAFARRRPEWARVRAGCSMLSCSS